MNFPSWPTLCLALLFLPFVLSLISPTCKPQEEVLFTEDPTDPQAFLSCKPYASSPSIGFWERHFCPNDMHFESGTQQCTANSLPPNMVREANDILQIAILNGTCSRGEQCIGGTLCDPVHQRCLCPSGTVAILETLSCAKLTPLSQQSVYSSQQQQFWRAPFGSYPQYPQGQQIPSQVPPGSSCERGEACGGGSVCMRQMGICLCPAHTENQNGQCVPLAIKSGDGLQSAKELIGQGGFFKIPLGEQCNEYLGLFCADQSAICGNGRCQCVPPMLERDGHCQMPPSREAGPGELCNADRVCTRGSVCNRQMPICVCPEGTILDNGWCVANQQQQKATATSSAPMIPIGERSQPIVGPRQKEAQVGEKCSLNADCASGAYCNGNSQPPTCQCLSTHVNVNNHCEKVIYPGEKGCETDLQCSAGYAGARCINGLCICPPGSTAIDQTCIPDRPKSSDPLLSTQQNCTFRPSLCSGGSICIAGRCECPDGKKQKKGRNTECQGAEMEEEEREKGPFASEQQKLQQQQQRAPQHAPPPTRTTPMSQKLASPGTQCGPLDICTGGSSCVEGICLCPAGTRPSLHANDCETFGQRKSDEASNGGMRRNDEEEEEMKEADTRPRPIKANQKTASSMTTSATVKSPPPSTTPAPPPQPASQLIANNANSSSTEIDKPPTLPAVSPNPVTPSNCSSGGGRCARSCSPPEDGGLQDCPNLASSPNMTSVNGTKKSQRRPYARPSESCANREICTGGSVCQRQTKVCECPSKKPLLRNHICIQSDEQRRPSEAGPGEMCNAETQCLGETICVDGMCRCRDGLGAEGGKCPRALSSNDDGGRQTSQRSAVPAELAIQSPPQEMLPPVKLATESETGEESGKQESDADSSAAPIRSSSRPRISGPPLRKISSSSSSSTSIGGRQVAPEGTTGVCPPGNVPTTDPSTGHLLICNGMTPNCPPKSYCFVTGEASETYNCCKAY